jgi:hypothetical protein
MWTVSIPYKSSYDKLRGHGPCDRVGTLGGDGWSVLDVTTLGDNGVLVMSCVLSVVCDHICRDRGMEE